MFYRSDPWDGSGRPPAFFAVPSCRFLWLPDFCPVGHDCCNVACHMGKQGLPGRCVCQCQTVLWPLGQLTSALLRPADTQPRPLSSCFLDFLVLTHASWAGLTFHGERCSLTAFFCPGSFPLRALGIQSLLCCYEGNKGSELRTMAVESDWPVWIWGAA